MTGQAAGALTQASTARAVSSYSPSAPLRASGWAHLGADDLHRVDGADVAAGDRDPGDALDVGLAVVDRRVRGGRQIGPEPYGSHGGAGGPGALQAARTGAAAPGEREDAQGAQGADGDVHSARSHVPTCSPVVDGLLFSP